MATRTLTTWENGALETIRQNWLVGQTFNLPEVYAVMAPIVAAHPDNQHAEAKIRQVLQYLRDRGDIEFLGGYGQYRRLR